MGFIRKFGGKGKKACVRLQRRVKGSSVRVCMCVCVCVFNKRKDSIMREDVGNAIMLTHLSPNSQSSPTVRGIVLLLQIPKGYRNA